MPHPESRPRLALALLRRHTSLFLLERLADAPAAVSVSGRSSPWTSCTRREGGDGGGGRRHTLVGLCSDILGRVVFRVGCQVWWLSKVD